MHPKIVVVDVGTHKGQEVRLLADSSWRWRLAVFFSLLRHHRDIRLAWQALRAIVTAQIFLATQDFRFALVEPILHPEIIASMRLRGPSIFIKGVTSAQPSGEVMLRLAKAGDLGHSIIASKPNLSEATLATYNVDFRKLLPWILGTFDVSAHDLVILRMNAEGVEQGIIEWLTEDPMAANAVQVIMGSLGDIKKCFGKAAEDAASSRLKMAGIPFIYFTSNAGSWPSAMNAIVSFIQNRREIAATQKSHHPST